MKLFKKKSLVNLIKKEFGDGQGMHIYNFISEEYRKMVPATFGASLACSENYTNRKLHKQLYYECYKIIQDEVMEYFSEDSWKKYKDCLILFKQGGFSKLKKTIKNELAEKLNSKIDEFAEQHKKIECPRFAYKFSAFTINVLTELKNVKIEKKEKNIDFVV